jgi:predicted ATPase
MSERNPWYVITGGPCAGKTTLIREFEADGIRVVHESARVIIERGFAAGKTLDEIRMDPAQFTRDIIALDTANLDLHPNLERVFFDRSILDNIAYHTILGLTPSPELLEAAERANFTKVFLPDLLDYQLDDARNETPEEAARIHAALEEAYREYKIPVVKVPVLPVAERVEFIVENL